MKKIIDEREYLKANNLQPCYCPVCRGFMQHRPTDEELEQQMESDARAMEQMEKESKEQ